MKWGPGCGREMHCGSWRQRRRRQPAAAELGGVGPGCRGRSALVFGVHRGLPATASQPAGCRARQRVRALRCSARLGLQRARCPRSQPRNVSKPGDGGGAAAPKARAGVSWAAACLSGPQCHSMSPRRRHQPFAGGQPQRRGGCPPPACPPPPAPTLRSARRSEQVHHK